jgi:hypothetical protein
MADEAKWIQRWEKQRAGGRGRFILLTGLLGYGLPMFIVMTFFVNRRVLNARSILVGAVLWPVGGLVFGALMWWASERRYAKHLEKLRKAASSRQAI